MVVTEFAFVTVRPEVQADVLREGTKTGDLIRHVMATALRQPGAREAHYAAAVERPNQLWLFLDWDTLEDHERYRTTETNATIMSQIAPIIDPLAGGSIAHIEPSVCPVFADPSAPVVEVLRMFFPGNIDGAAKADVVARWNRFADKVLREPGASGPIAANWTLETNVEVPGQPDKQAVAFVALVAWASIERHMQCRDTQVFTDNIGILRELPGLIKLDMFHVKCQTLHSKDVARGALAESS